MASFFCAVFPGMPRLGFTPLRRGTAVALAAAATALAALTGCGMQRIDDRANEQIEDARATADHSVVYASCGDNMMFGEGCGLVARYAATPSYRARFRASRCAGLSDGDCNELYADTIDRWMATRYRYADFARIDAACDTTPERCDLVSYEKLLLDSHDAAVRDRYARSVNAIEAQREREKAAAVDRTTGIVVETAGAIDYATHGGPKCRIYPNVTTGVGYSVCTH